MTIGGISDYGYMYRPYPVDRIPTVDASSANQVDSKPQQMETPVKESAQSEVSLASQSQTVERKNAPLEDISLTFNKDDTFDMIGSSSDLSKLDMDKAISDMKKDSILQDYSYFVGAPAGRIQSASEDGIVIAK